MSAAGGECQYWDPDGCYCVCGVACSCHPPGASHGMPPIPDGMTDWRQATPEEIMGDIACALGLTASPRCGGYSVPLVPGTKRDIVR